MKIIYSEKFSKNIESLPKNIRKIFEKQESLFKNNWHDSRLQIKKLVNRDFLFSFRVTRAYRVLFVFVETDKVLFTRIAHRKDVYE